MDRLSGSSYSEIACRLKTCGFELDRQAKGSREIWYNPTIRRGTVVPHHPSDTPEGTLRSIPKRADITLDRFLQAR